MPYNSDLTDLRVECNLSQKQVALVLGLSSAYVSSLESGEVDNISIEVLTKLSKVYNVESSLVYRAFQESKLKRQCELEYFEKVYKYGYSELLEKLRLI